MRLSLLLCVGFLINACSDGPTQKSDTMVLSGQQRFQIDSICEAFINKGNTVGLSLAISHQGNVLFSKGYGLANIESVQTATDSTIYPIASISKFITAITTMKLVEEGKLRLSDKVSSFLKGLPKQEHMDKITIEHLLRHQSGLVDHEDWFDSIYIHHKRVFSDQELYAFLNQPLFFEPGTHYSYSNSGYALLSNILERIEGKSFHDLIREKIGGPLDLKTLGMWQEQWHDPNATMGYEIVDQKIDTSFHMMTKGMKGDGGLSASVLDLTKLMHGLTRDSLISRQSLEAMLTPTSLGAFSIDYGLGVKFGEYSGQMTFGHSGGYKGTGWAILAHYPESGYTFAAAMNTNYTPEEIWNLRHLVMPIVLKVQPPDMRQRSIKDMEKYVGNYTSIDRWGKRDPSLRVVTSVGDTLLWDNPNTIAPGAQLFQLNDSIFTWKAYPYDSFKFHQVGGKVVACSEYYDGMFGMVRIKEDVGLGQE